MGKQHPAKLFKYDVLIESDDICGRKAEQQDLLRRAKAKKQTIIFAPRRYGKTSLVKNVIGTSFSKLSRHHLVLFFDLMGVQSLESIAKRLHHGISQSLSQRFPVKTLLKDVTGYLKGISIQVEIDAITGLPSLSLTTKGREAHTEINLLLQTIKSLSQRHINSVSQLSA